MKRELSVYVMLNEIEQMTFAPGDDGEKVRILLYEMTIDHFS